LHLTAADAKTKFLHLVGAHPAVLDRARAHRRHDKAEGHLNLRPPVTTCDGQAGASALAQGSFVGISDADHDVWQRFVGDPAKDLNTYRPKKEMLTRLATEIVHKSPPSAQFAQQAGNGESQPTASNERV
jgi:hypothetical protein